MMSNVGYSTRASLAKPPEKDRLDKLLNENMIVTSQGHQRWQRVKGKYISYKVTQEAWDLIFNG